MAKQFKATLIEVIGEALSESCFENTSENLKYIDDLGDNQKCTFTNNEKDTFRINNPTEKELYLLSVDGCWFRSSDKSRCDGIIFDDLVLCFFELKLNATSTRNKRKKDNFKKAISQLEETINHTRTAFHTNNVELEHNLEAYVCMRPNSYPNNKASVNQKRVEFLERNRIPLFPENEKSFRE
ncbi:MAG: hypothetical protein PHN55_15535 [Dysgonamonadaceae bacterium]|nr:hypothetical protein [Dysgonamonadaceae bacterium]